jgi:hypothetical protein
MCLAQMTSLRDSVTRSALKHNAVYTVVAHENCSKTTRKDFDGKMSVTVLI